MSDKISRLESYLVEHVGNGVEYVRAKEISEEIDLTPKQVGVFLSQLRNKEDSEVVVSKWARHKSTTWQVKKSKSV